MHIDGQHVAELEAPVFEGKDHSVYVRPTDEGGGEVGLEVVVVSHRTNDVRRVPVPAAAVQQAALEAALQEAIAAGPDTTGDEAEDGSEPE